LTVPRPRSLRGRPQRAEA